MIPLFKPSCSDLEIRYVTETLRSGWWAMGPKVEELESKFAAYVGARYAIATNSATTALELALTVLRTNSTREQFVICPALTFISTALAAKRAGYKIVFADINPQTLLMDWQDVNSKNYWVDDVIVPVWYGGRVDARLKISDDLLMVEDCAHAAGSKNAGKTGQLSCWSFQAVKNLAAGDGGMITTQSEDYAKRLRALRWCGIDRSTWDRDNKRPYGWDYNVTEDNGSKAHMNDITAALALAQLERLDELNAKRRGLVRRYQDQLRYIPYLEIPFSYLDIPQDKFESSSWHLFYVRMPPSIRDRFIDHMLASGVSAGVHYKPLTHYKIFGRQAPLPYTEAIWKELVTLPLYPDLTEQDQDQVINAIRKFEP